MSLADFDREAGLACMEGDESLYDAVVAVFYQQLTGEFAGLPMALRERHSEAVSRQVHTLKGSAGSVGAKRLEAAASAVDRELKSGVSEVSTSLIDELDSALHSAIDVMQTGD